MALPEHNSHRWEKEVRMVEIQDEGKFRRGYLANTTEYHAVTDSAPVSLTQKFLMQTHLDTRPIVLDADTTVLESPQGSQHLHNQAGTTIDGH